MSFRDRMKQKKNGLKKRHNQVLKPSGGRFPTVFDKKKVPDGVNFFVCKEGQHIIDILPWEAGPDMPLDEQNIPVTKEGDFDYVLDLWVHQNVGKIKVPFVCPYENFGLPCPICKYIKANRLPKDEWSKKRAKRRSIYLIWDRTSPENEKKGVQIFDSAHFFMEEKLEEIAKLPRGGGYITFSDPDEGQSICWTRKGSGQENTQYLGHKFIEREAPVPDRILEQTFNLDQVITMHPEYEEIEKAFNSSDEEENKDQEEETPFEEKEKDIDDTKFKSPGGDTKAAAPKAKVVLKRKVKVRTK
jgi:hypothetical protein